MSHDGGFYLFHVSLLSRCVYQLFVLLVLLLCFLKSAL